ncbi:transcriptional regulator [Methylomagnum ishizawai]|uniref:transcriptional regulator n=1 Tax=Methylomagnum ishizawai TaxID=1760988 RepID=UPI001C335D6E|nr:transcriptional regulator [Methylomagnum ishizawai]BBL75532.1 hypothetical protein MishRS11D_26300 [Methylomagnum ishizawai]
MESPGWTTARPGQLPYTYENFARAKVFLFEKWRERAVELRLDTPVDLSGSCKYGSLFMQAVFGGTIRGHFQHQYNFIDGRLVDLSHDAADVGRMCNPYLHEPEYFAIPELQASLARCLPRVECWTAEFLADPP